MRLWLVLLAAWLAAAPTASADTRRPAGYVVGVETPEGAPAPVLRRQGQELDMQIWTALFDGDVIEASGKASVTIETQKDKRLVVDASRAPHRVSGELGGGGKFAGLAGRLGELFKAKPDATPTNLVGRSDGALRLRLGDEPGQKVVAGKPIWLAWRGGTPPFVIALHGQTRQRKLDVQTLARADTENAEARLVIPAHASGGLRLVVRDAAGQEVRAALNVESAPTPPDWIASGAPPTDMAVLAMALHLLMDKPAQHDFYAAGLASALEGAPARELLNRLKRGERPK
jgi:hypothetical protein